MQLAEALAPEEVQVLGRLVTTVDAKKAIEAKFQVVSLRAVIEAGGFAALHGDSFIEARMQEVYLDPAWPRIGARGQKIKTVTVPKLAVAPSRARAIRYRGIGRTMFFSVGDKWELSVKCKRDLGSGPSFDARTPIIPAAAKAIVDQFKFSLVLWEADWKPVPVPLGDPAILIPLIGDLYAVGAVWDLTELEKTVLQKAFV